MFWKFFRKTDPHTSVMAAAELDHVYVEDQVYAAIAKFGENGCISDDVCGVLPHLHSNTVTPRYRRLLQLGRIEVTGASRKGFSGRNQRVMRVCKK